MQKTKNNFTVTDAKAFVKAICILPAPRLFRDVTMYRREQGPKMTMIRGIILRDITSLGRQNIQHAKC